MSKRLWQTLTATPVVLGASLLLTNEVAAQNLPGEAIAAPQANLTSVSDVMGQIDRYSNFQNENTPNALGQDVPGASQFSDVSPSDWAFQALDDLVRRYDCLKGYPNGTFRGNRALSRYEFAAGLNACLQQIERLLAEATANLATKEDLETLRRLMQEFEAELAALGARIDSLEARVSFLEDNQFSTTTKLNGEVIMGLAGLLPASDTYDTNFSGTITSADSKLTSNLVLHYRARLNFDTSFTGRDRLRTRLQGANILTFSPLSNASNPGGGTTINNTGGITREGRLGYEGSNDNVILEQLNYRFPLSNKATAQIWAHGVGMNDLLVPLTPFESSGQGAISRFGRYNPILRVGGQGSAGAAITYQFSKKWQLDLGYTTGEANNPDNGSGLFGGDYALGAQLKYKSDKWSAALVFINGYNDNGLLTGTGSIASDMQVRTGTSLDGSDNIAPVASNSYGLELLFRPSSRFFVGAWAGMTNGIVIGRGSANAWNYALSLGLQDLGGKGNVLGLILGQEPRLVGTSFTLNNLGNRTRGLGNLLGNTGSGAREDLDTGYHLEAFYKLRLNDNISITPGLIWLTSPGHNGTNPNILVGAVRTTFTF